MEISFTSMPKSVLATLEPPSYPAGHLVKTEFIQIKGRGLKPDFVMPLPDFRVIKNSEV